MQQIPIEPNTYQIYFTEQGQVKDIELVKNSAYKVEILSGNLLFWCFFQLPDFPDAKIKLITALKK